MLQHTSTYYKSPILFCGYLDYLKSYRIDSVFKICVCISVFRRQKQFVNPLLGLQVTTIFMTLENSGVFFKCPVGQIWMSILILSMVSPKYGDVVGMFWLSTVFLEVTPRHGKRRGHAEIVRGNFWELWQFLDCGRLITLILE